MQQQLPLTEMINNAICERPEILCEALGIEKEIIDDKISTSCIIHGGDHPSGMRIYFNRGKWGCYTRGCQNIFKSSLIGLTRGILSVKYCNWSKPGDKIYSWNKTLKFLKGLYNIDGEIKFDPVITERNTFVNSCKECNKPEQRFIMTRDCYLKVNNNQSEYFISRGFSPEILNKYDIYSCCNKDKPFFRRSLIPVYTDDYKSIIGISARTECDEIPKWKHTKKFPSTTNLFNLWHAKEYIRKSRTAIICEGPLDVLKLEQAGIHNGVAIWGCAGFNDYKRLLLDKLSVMKLVLALDNDDAGREASQKIQSQYGRFYNIVNIRLSATTKDVGELSIEECKDIFHDIN